MGSYEDYDDLMQDEWLSKYVDEELQRLAEAPVFDYLAHYGDAIEDRVRACVSDARALAAAGFHGAALVRAAAGIEITIRFFLPRPLVQGAFLSNECSRLLSQKVLNGRTADDRDLLPAILRNWGIDLIAVTLPDGPTLGDGRHAGMAAVKRLCSQGSELHRARRSFGNPVVACVVGRSSRARSTPHGIYSGADKLLVRYSAQQPSRIP